MIETNRASNYTIFTELLVGSQLISSQFVKINN